MRSVLVSLVLALGVLPAPERDECRKCKGAGVVACRPCAKDPCGERAVQPFCTVRIDCDPCGGLGAVDCRRCEREDELAAEHAARREANRTWRESVRSIDEAMGRQLLHAETDHFRLTYDIPRLDVKGVRTPHAGMHLYMDRMEELFARFTADLGADPAKDFLGKTHVLLWNNARDQERASTHFTRQPSTTQSKLMGPAPVVSIHYDKAHLHEEFELHQAVVHQVTHCLLSNVFDGIWPGNIGGGWIDAGLAHHYETALFGGVRHYCYVESDTLFAFKFGKWEATVRSAVDRKEAKSLLGVAGRHTTDLSPEDHMYAWSFTDYVLRRHPGRFGALARALKAKRPLKDALRDALDLAPFAFDEAWRTFVREEYSLRPRRR